MVAADFLVLHPRDYNGLSFGQGRHKHRVGHGATVEASPAKGERMAAQRMAYDRRASTARRRRSGAWPRSPERVWCVPRWSIDASAQAR